MSQAKQEALEWLERFHEVNSSLNAEKFVTEFFTEDAVMQYANNPPVKGHHNLIQNFKANFDQVDMLEHETEHVDVLPDRIYQTIYVSFKVKGDPEVIRLRGLRVFHKTSEEQKMQRYDVFADITPIMEKIKRRQQV
ncbi:hypothetical protein I4U23_017125 [Adineta vaga]|nr:hypothetical protein I4U23_017125 [Adineta vaga]